MTPEYIMRKSLCREPFCASGNWQSMAKSYIENLVYCTEYAEPGYDNPKKAILFCNWNYFPIMLADILEKYGYAIEWEDEWTRCNGCYKALRTSPDSHSWQPSYIENTETGECFCRDCVTDDDIACLEDNPTHTINLDGIDLTQHGYRELQCDYIAGLREGSNDDPKQIYNALYNKGHSRLLFQVSNVDQFDISFCVWEKITDESEESL